MGLDHWLNELIILTANRLGIENYFVLKAFLALVLVSVICGSVGSLVIGNRMAFFSDAIAHCAFAGITLGVLLLILTRPGARIEDDDWLVPGVFVSFGVVIGVMIAFVREKTSLANDTVIGIFFAGAIGFGAILFGALAPRVRLSPED